MRRIGETNLYVMPAGAEVANPLELLTLKKVKQTLDELRDIFSWIILDSRAADRGRWQLAFHALGRDIWWFAPGRPSLRRFRWPCSRCAITTRLGL